MTDFVYPNYEGESLLNLPSTILSIFGGKALKPTLPKDCFETVADCQKIILFLIDGLGNNLFQKYALNHEFFQKASSGSFKEITSVFPSTTAAAISTINSGLSPLEHGLPEWNVYFREIDAVIQTLPFVPQQIADLPKLEKAPPEMLFNQKTIFEYLQEINIPSYSFLYKPFLESPYNQNSSKGSTVIPFVSLADLLVKLKMCLSEVKGKAYFYVYWDAVDSAEHLFGPNSEQAQIEIALLAKLLQEEFVNKLNRKTLKESGLFLSADHGQIDTNPNETIYLDDYKKFFKISANGSPILPSGSARDMFLNIDEQFLEQVKNDLEEKFADKAEIIKMSDVVAKGWFGQGSAHPEFFNRIGNLLILPKSAFTFWYHFDLTSKKTLRGRHGGLSSEEMIIPLVSCRLEDF